LQHANVCSLWHLLNRARNANNQPIFTKCYEHPRIKSTTFRLQPLSKLFLKTCAQRSGFINQFIHLCCSRNGLTCMKQAHLSRKHHPVHVFGIPYGDTWQASFGIACYIYALSSCSRNGFTCMKQAHLSRKHHPVHVFGIPFGDTWQASSGIACYIYALSSCSRNGLTCMKQAHLSRKHNPVHVFGIPFGDTRQASSGIACYIIGQAIGQC
jgi:hypothetical protein